MEKEAVKRWRGVVFVYFKYYSGDMQCVFLRRLLVQLFFRKICCESKSYVFLMVLKSYFVLLRVVTTIMYLTSVWQYTENVLMKPVFS